MQCDVGYGVTYRFKFYPHQCGRGVNVNVKQHGTSAEEEHGMTG